MTTIRESMAELARARQEKYSTVVWEHMPSILDYRERVILGMTSWCLTESAQRYLLKSALVENGNGPQTGPEIGRDYLKAKYPGQRQRAFSEQRDNLLLHRSPPLYCLPGRIPSAAYVDIKSAYWSIIMAVGWDVDYYPEHWLGKKSHNRDFPLVREKVARNSLVTAGLSSPRRVWTGYGFRTEHSQNTHLNYGIWAVCQDVLNAIAGVAVFKLGAQYCHTDGFIIRSERAQDLIDYIASWGLDASVKREGEAEIWRVASYRVGGYSTKTMHSPWGETLSKIAEVNEGWLRPRFRRWVELSQNW